MFCCRLNFLVSLHVDRPQAGVEASGSGGCLQVVNICRSRARVKYQEQLKQTEGLPVTGATAGKCTL